MSSYHGSTNIHRFILIICLGEGERGQKEIPSALAEDFCPKRSPVVVALNRTEQKWKIHLQEGQEYLDPIPGYKGTWVGERIAKGSREGDSGE